MVHEIKIKLVVGYLRMLVYLNVCVFKYISLRYSFKHH